MANYQLLKADIDAKVYENAHREITGEKLNSVLNAMVTTLGAEYQFAGVATIDINPGTPDAKVFYIAKGKGTYTNFGGLEVTEDEVVVLYYDTEWHKVATGIASQAKLAELDTQTASLNSRTPVDSGISFLKPWEFFPEYSEDVQDVQNYISPGFLQINNQMTSVDGLFNHIRDNNLAGKAAYFTIQASLGTTSAAIIGNIDDGAVGYKISFSTISRYSDDTSFNNRLIFFEIEIGDPSGDGITIMNSRLMNICIKDTLSQIDNNTSKIQTLETKNTELTNTITELETRVTNAVQITYAELKSLRDAGKLIPGTQYRITDYTCTTTQANTKSAGHQFDIIVTADDESTLNEAARAAKHDADTYFANNDLSAWQIWYCLDNDTTRFAWADSTNGKGVIYRMIDEWNNDVPYDFKNIQYNGSWGYWAYTFNWIKDSSDNSCEDLSVAQYAHTNSDGGYSHTYGNVIKPCELGEGGNYGVPFKLNACVFLNTESYAGGYFFGCNSNTFENNCYNNTFRNNCYSNKFGNSCYSNSFGNNCYRNTFGNSCYNNNLSDYCYSNSLGDGCYNNILMISCYYNTFENNCYSNTLDGSCTNNTLGGSCHDNSFGNNCSNNTFGNSCYSNSFGNDCYYNSFGNYCYYIKFASDGSTSTKYNYYRANHFGDGCKYIIFTGAETASTSAQVQNYNFAQGLQGTSNAYLTIDGKRSRAYETKVAKNSNGEIKIYCEADLIL